MNQGKLDVVKEEMARVNVTILGISELKWTGMGEFNSDDHYIFYCGQESLRRNGVAIMVNKSPKYSSWMQSQKRQNDLCSFPRQTIQYHGNPSSHPSGTKRLSLARGVPQDDCGNLQCNPLLLTVKPEISIHLLSTGMH